MVTGGRPALARWRWTVTAAFGLGGITISAWGPRLPAIKAGLGVGTATIGLLLAGVTVGAILGLLASTPVLHWLGSRRSVAGALLLIAAAMTVMGLALILGSVPLVAVAFVIIGAGIGTLDVLINVEGAAVEQAAGRTLMPMMHAAWSIGVAVGSGIGAACAALGVTPSAQLIGEAVLIAAAALGTAPESAQGRRAPAGPPSRGPGSEAPPVAARLAGLAAAAHRRRHARRRARRRLRRTTGSPWRCGTTTGRPPQSPRCSSPRSPSARGSPGSSPAPSSIASDASVTVRVTTALGIVGVVLFIQAGNRWIVLVGVLLWAVGVSMGFPLGMSAAAESGPDPAARVSVVASIGYFANLAGPPAIGLLSALWLIVALFLAAFAAAG